MSKIDILATFRGGLALALFLGMAHAAQGATLEVTIDNVPSDQGNIIACLANETGFLKTCSSKLVVAATKGRVRLVFDNVEPGKYALSASHDENRNGRLDKNLLGIPTESYGFSRDAKVRFGPPAFADAVFEVRADAVNVQAFSLRN